MSARSQHVSHCVRHKGRGFSCSAEVTALLLLAKHDRKAFNVSMQVQTALGAIVRAPQARELPCGVFGSFGWSGEAVDELENRLKVNGAMRADRLPVQ